MNFNKHTVTPTFATSFIFDNFIPTYHSLHVCSRQALLCARLAACHVPLVNKGGVVSLMLALSPGPAQKIGKGAWSHLQNVLYVLSQCIM